ncbi:MAG: hypothetical protein JWO69_2029 [Thermoleophilia bacterium]|nr:hypothetical protein [Thermoleophilia bacterium]
MRLEELLHQTRAAKARREALLRLSSVEASIERCHGCGAWTIQHLPCSTPFCHRAVEVAS